MPISRGAPFESNPNFQLCRVQRFSACIVFLMISLYMSQSSVSSRNFRLFAEWFFVGVLFLACTLRKSIVSIVYSGLLIICIWNLSKKKKSSRVCNIVAVALSTLVVCGHIVATFVSQKVGYGEWSRSFSGWRSSDSILFISGILEFWSMVFCCWSSCAFSC